MGGNTPELTSIEICAGAGGQAVGLHAAGFRHLALVEIDEHAVETLNANIKKNPADGWKWESANCAIFNEDVKQFHPYEVLPGLKPRHLDLLAGGVPCPPFSIAGKQLGQDDERDLFPRMLELVDELKPRAVMIENVRGLLEPAHKFRSYRKQILQRLRDAGYVVCGWNVLEAADFGVPQLRPRAILVAIREDCYRGFTWPKKGDVPQKYVFETLQKSMQHRCGTEGGKGPGLKTPTQRALAAKAYKKWADDANGVPLGIAPTLVGGSKKHGGADLGPTRAKKAWTAFGVNGLGVANEEDDRHFERDLDRDLLDLEKGIMLTVSQAALIQGFPDDWKFQGGKTARYRQVGNAFPPPVAEAVGRAIAEALGRTGPLVPAPVLEDDRYEDIHAQELLPISADTSAGIKDGATEIVMIPAPGVAEPAEEALTLAD
ncbi:MULTISPECIES: DNA (cytosine-5-)-methyltransferase [unclassified Streptomyces]|uniref:DNA cytosine methyltransferase n=1 Tax=unclassified Streptomyces TaxID=2593676 RepID=UPI0006872A83|nr:MULTISPECIES: DNA (cytosine-5-)-methyltransferase [unclassified Streptomyces]MYX34358.1 DNA (cytosine-5-)-methyltransferase [Streptomyces sp. SID8377]